MKLLSSDYDRTLNTFGYDLYLNNFFVNKFMKENVFLLNTGRNFKSIKREIDKYHINYNYLSCCDGNLIFNKKNDIIYSTDLKKEISDELNELCLTNKVKLNAVSFDKKVLEYEVIVLGKNKEFTYKLVHFCNKNGLRLKQFKFYNFNVFYIGDQNVNKAYSTKLIGELENIKKYDIFTIGDQINDLEMIKEFNGYALPWSIKEIKEVSQGTCIGVFSLIKKISR